MPLQGTLLFVGLLLLLWVPLLVFSSGNPTYTPPQVLSFHANATLGRSPVGASGALDSGGGGWLKRNAGSGGSGVAMGQARPIPGSVSGGGGPGRAYQQAMAGDNSRGHTSSRLAGRWAGEPPEQPAAAVHPVVQFPLYAAGDRRASGQWSGGDNGTLPAGLADYDPSQLQLLCLSEVRWAAGYCSWRQGLGCLPVRLPSDLPAAAGCSRAVRDKEPDSACCSYACDCLIFPSRSHYL